MPNTTLPAFYIGWDVGAWNCEKNSKSRDALVILDDQLVLTGKPWRGSLRPVINEAATTAAFIKALFDHCDAPQPAPEAQITLAIDAPLGFSEGFVNLVHDRTALDVPIETFRTNPYLHRQSELRLFRQGHKPLSPVQDMIGSQATKAMHVLAKFAPLIERCGVWSDGARLTAIEAYPAPCKGSGFIAQLHARVTGPTAPHGDQYDALTCALIAYSFTCHPERLQAPDDTIPTCEGWIWIPNDVLRSAES